MSCFVFRSLATNEIKQLIRLIATNREPIRVRVDRQSAQAIWHLPLTNDPYINLVNNRIAVLTDDGFVPPASVPADWTATVTIEQT